MDSSFISTSLAILSILAISSGLFLLSKKIKFPYTVLLVIVGIILVPLSQMGFFHFFNDFQLTPELLFFVFLPILIFESGYNMNYRQILKNWKSIGILSIFGLLISTFIIGYGLHYGFKFIGWDIPLSITLLFGSIISATDPVAVLALFKEFGAPRRLVLIFEGESLFNDGTALALFLVMFEVVRSGVLESSNILYGIATFTCMILGGMIFGGFAGWIFSNIIGKVKNNEYVEIGLTMILAHITFILAELISEHIHILGFEVKISGVIATSIAAIVAGNYGRYKISHKVEEYMEKFWGFVAFVANSLVFMLMGTMFFKLNIHFQDFIIPIAIVIGVVIIARAISVYGPIIGLNLTKTEEHIPSSWQHLLAWGSLRGALALMMVLMIPDNFTINGWSFSFTIKEFLLAITIGSIMFTLFIKATTIGYMINKLGISKLHNLEKFEKQEGRVLICLEILKKIEKIHQKGYITQLEYESLNNDYKSNLENAILELKNLLSGESSKADELVFKALSLHALGIEKQYLKELFKYHEVDEYIFKYMLGKINRQIERIENGLPQIKGDGAIEELGFMDKLLEKIYHKNDTVVDKYLKNRTKFIISGKVIKELQRLKDFDFGFDKSQFDKILDMYIKFNEQSKVKMHQSYELDKNLINLLSTRLVNKSLIKLEEKTVNNLFEKEFITPKLYHEFLDEIEEKIYKDIKNIN